ncbi:MMPL family transporter [bacterium]|nr:MMPL family transporter [bacterium]
MESTSLYKKEKIISIIIILLIIGITSYFLTRIPELSFTGSVSDLIVVDEDKPVLSGEVTAEESDELVVIVSNDNLFSVKGFKEVERITKGFEEFVIPDKSLGAVKKTDVKKEEAPKFLLSVLSITNSSVPKSNPITDRNMDKKTKMGCKYAFQQAEKSYEKYKDTALSQIRFDLNQKPIFPKFPEPDFKDSVNYLSFQTFWQELPQDDNELRLFLNDISQPIFMKNFISPGKKDVAIILSVSRKSKYDPELIIGTLRKAAKKLEKNGYKIIVAGDLVLKEEVRTNIIEDSKFFMKLAAFLWCISFGICFGTIRGIFLPLISLLVSEIWLLGTMAVFGLNLNIVLYIVPIFLVAVGSSASIHIMSKFYTNVKEGMHHIDAAVESFKELIVPVGTASATTALGFAMLMLSNVKGLNHFTLLCIAGLMFNTINSLMLLPCINIWLPAPKVKIVKEEIGVTSRWMGFIKWIIKFRKPLIAIFMVLSLFSILGIIVIVPDNDLTKLISKDSQSLKDLDYLSKKLAGTTVMTLVLEANPGRFMNKDMLKRIDELQKVLEKSPYIDKTTSVVDLLRMTRHLSDGGRPTDRPMFKHQYMINSNIHFMENLKEDEAFKSSATAIEKLMRAFSSKDYSTALVMIRSNVTSLRLMKIVTKMIDTNAAKILGNGVKISLKGEILSINKAIEMVLTGQTQGVIFALLTIFILMLILFFSFKIAVLCVIPNIFPILFFYGYLGFTGIGLDLSSGLIACVAIGIAVDDTIHFMVEMRKYMQRTYDVGDAMLSSIKSVGMPIINTSFVLSIMFGMLYFSKFQVFSSLGILQSQTMLLCLVCNLVLLPAILSSFRIVSIWNILTRFHGFDPSKVVLLDGMSPLSCRIVLGLGKLVDLKKGEVIVKQDEQGDEMYIVINGRARVYKEKADKMITLKLMDSGDLFGEMAVFGSPVRSATVRAETDIKLLAISKEFFEHAETLYPRTCSRFLKNVISIVSQRLRTVNYSITDKVPS